MVAATVRPSMVARLSLTAWADCWAPGVQQPATVPGSPPATIVEQSKLPAVQLWKHKQKQHAEIIVATIVEQSGSLQVAFQTLHNVLIL